MPSPPPFEPEAWLLSPNAVELGGDEWNRDGLAFDRPVSL
jgi:hypothetical protein